MQFYCIIAVLLYNFTQPPSCAVMYIIAIAQRYPLLDEHGREVVMDDEENEGDGDPAYRKGVDGTDNVPKGIIGGILYIRWFHRKE